MKKENDYNDILSLVTHDLKSPMTAVLASFELLSLDDLTKKEKEDALKQGRKASASILKLIENILVMAKVEAGKENIELSLIDDLEDRFLDIAKTFRYERKLKNINLKLSMHKKLPKVKWDMDKIQYHVINNIVSNALKFTPSKGTIKINVYSKDKNSVSIYIRDNGLGIQSDKLKTIFNKYDTSDTKKLKGHGLGLYNAFHFVKAHKGDIQTTKGLDNKGVGFLITLPLDPSK